MEKSENIQNQIAGVASKNGGKLKQLEKAEGRALFTLGKDF